MLKGFVGVCNPYDFFTLDNHLESYLFGIYHRELGKHMKRLLTEHKEAFRPIEKDLGYTIEEGLKKVKTSRDFDTYFTSYVCQYHSARNYYRKASCALKIDDVRTPSLFINALDDPIVEYFCRNNQNYSKKVLPVQECLVNKNIILATHPCGGHLGFFTGLNPQQVFLRYSHM